MTGVQAAHKPPSVSGDHLSCAAITHGVMRHTRRFLWDEQPQCACFALLPVGFAWPQTLLPAPVVSYTTFSPSPSGFRQRHSVLCGTFPSGHPAWLLASTVLCGGRTFLDANLLRRDPLCCLDAASLYVTTQPACSPSPAGVGMTWVEDGERWH